MAVELLTRADPRVEAYGRLVDVIVDAGLAHRLTWIESSHVLDLVVWDCQRALGQGVTTPFRAE